MATVNCLMATVKVFKVTIKKKMHEWRSEELANFLTEFNKQHKFSPFRSVGICMFMLLLHVDVSVVTLAQECNSC